MPNEDSTLRWLHAFATSRDRFRGRAGSGLSSSPIWRKLLQEAGFEIAEQKESVFDAFFEDLIQDFVSHHSVDLAYILNVTESPLEEVMGLALHAAGRDIFGDAYFQFNGHEYVRAFRGGTTNALRIEPQRQLGDYRVDFLTTGAVQRFVDGGPREGTRELLGSAQIIVECDGHDFHDRTKAQARRDKRRDRALQLLGLDVFHYTGSELFEDVFKCAHEVVERLHEVARSRGAPAIE
jgi:very-short-patch-repair endonuclease